MAKSSRRHYGDGNRQVFYDAIRVMREACITVCRTAPINGLDYRTAAELLTSVDRAVEVLTGDRRALWRQPHSNSFTAARETPLRPVETDKEQS